MYTVTQLAKRANISRTTLLYYEKEGLLTPALRADNGYRYYGEAEDKKLAAIVSYRAYGLSVANIATLLNKENALEQPQLLKEHFNQLEQEVAKLRQQQRAIVILLKAPDLLENEMVNKQRWVEIMLEAGFDEAAMVRWHQTFEKLEPKEHQKFLESLSIDAEEIKRIRAL
ncbi:MerR family transcriptional regulator [Shewanella sp. 10N.261.52.F9]|uniref:MerR family transcriptional regulator n=1 Tax=Shewanella sp. 10N.261.52.F9 TaxID=3229684 RepID=UPI00354DEF64